MIREKVFHLPPPAQEEVLREVEEIEQRYRAREASPHRHALDEIAEIVVEGLPTDLSARHDFYAHAKVED